LQKDSTKGKEQIKPLNRFTLMSLTLQENMRLVILSSLAIEGHQEDLTVEASLICTTEKRFDQHQSLEPVFALENLLLLKACNGEPHEEDLNVLEASCYQDDLDCDKLRRQLLLCAEVIKQALPMVKKVTSVRTLCEAMKTNSTYKSMLSEVHKSLRLYLTISYHIGNVGTNWRFLVANPPITFIPHVGNILR